VSVRQTTVGEFLKETGGSIKTGPFGTKLKASEYTPDGVPVISVGEVGFGRLRLHEKTPRVDESVWHRMPEFILRTGDIVFGRKGAVERSAQVMPDEDGFFLGSDGIRIRLNNEQCDPRFFAYQFLTSSHRTWMVQHAAGSTMPSLNEGIIGRIPIIVPPLAEQKRIARILGTLDDKIELNRRMNATLEAMARAFFQSWFVDFNPVRRNAEGVESRPEDSLFPDLFEDFAIGEIPAGWDVMSLYDTATYRNGAPFKPADFCPKEDGLPVVKIAELKSSLSEQTKWSNKQLGSDQMIDTGDLLYSWSGSPDTSLDAFLWSNGPGLVNQHIFKVITSTNAEKRFVYYLLKHLRPILVETARDKQTTGLGHVTVADMKHLQVCRPPKDVHAAFDRLIAPIFDKAFANTVESQTLATLRDTLLPRLLSGDVTT
jgi:type I restriction enzyme, S subunit